MKRQKQRLRESVLEKRLMLTGEMVQDKSRRIIEQLMDMEAYRKSGWILCYLDFRKEVATGDFIEKSLSLGKRIAVPVVLDTDSAQRRMIASEIFSLEDDLEKGSFGIFEPRKEALRMVSPQELDIIAVPGVAFDTGKNRLGYGAGYYDRFLKQVRPDCIKVGICFEMQLVEAVPVGRYDVPLDMIITEERILL